ncbi:hypothetical protein [Sandarakinorhabdus sp.]|uniref:hypothetical protein n=1 Tax=Sandarakinorhabdus sp. TaxID=1916663 RepID=UPI00286E69BB|nr:hypothetical protein [Sandarakinorhabdus sp.]
MRAEPWLIAGGILSAAASLMHLAIIAGGPAWYRWFHAGDKMVAMAERGEARPWIITLGIAAVLAVFAACAFSAAGLIPRLPLLPLALVGITGVYLLRGLALGPLLVWRPHLVDNFILWSSLIVLVYGLVHAIGTWLVWREL